MAVKKELLWEHVLEKYGPKPKSWWRMCDLFSLDRNYSMFVAGIISGIPATLLMNLVTTVLSENPHPVWYSILYIFTFLASVRCCISVFRFAVKHDEVWRSAENKAAKMHGEDEETESELVIAFGERYDTEIRPLLPVILGSAAATFIGIVVLFLLMNVNF